MRINILFSLLVLYFSLNECLNAQGLKWARSIGGANYDWGYDIVLDSDANAYIVGVFEGSIDMDPGAGVTTFNSAGGYDIYLQKLDSSGNFVWAIQLGSTGADEAFSLALDGSNIVVTGNFSNTVDFDPSGSTTNLTSNGSSDVFIAKYTTSGGFVWAKAFGGMNVDNGRDIAVDASHHIYVTGSFNVGVDFDPGAGTFFLNSSGSSDVYVEKLDASGNFVWATQSGNIDPCEGRSIAIDSNDDVVVTGQFYGTVDFDPGAGVFNLAAGASYDAFVQKLDPLGSLIFAKAITGPSLESGYVITCDLSNNIFVAGVFMGSSSDLDPGAGTSLVASLGTTDNFVVKLDASGNYLWGGAYGGSTNDIIYGMTTDSDGFLYVTGFFVGTIDFDISTGIQNTTAYGDSDAYLLKMDPAGNYVYNLQIGYGGVFDAAEGNAIALYNDDIFFTGRFRGDADADPSAGVTIINCPSGTYTDAFILRLKQDECSDFVGKVDSALAISCSTGLGYASSLALNGASPYSYSWNTSPIITDSIATFITPGIYEVTISDANSCTKTVGVMINGPSTSSGFDMDVNMISAPFQLGFPSTIWLDASNKGCVPTSGQLSIVLSYCLDYLSAVPVPDMISGDTLIWNTPALVYDGAHFQPVISVNVPATGGCGPDGAVWNYVRLTPITSDFDTTNNAKDYLGIATNAYDPNDKKVYPYGECDAHYVKKSDKLTYTIRFQNTGTAPAVNVFVLDSLNSNLDLSTLNVLTRSHDMIVDILPGNVVKFRFDNIYLPDSSSDMVGSNGFVVFEILPSSSAADGSLVENKVGIYFDFNEAVVTNTVFNTLVSTIPSIDVSVTAALGTITANAGGLTYQWVDCDNGNDSIPGATSQTYSPTADGNYAVWISDGGCTEMSDCYEVLVSGVNEAQHLEKVLVYPNPSNGSEITIDLGTETGNVTLEVMDISGQMVFTKQLNQRISQINLNVSQGVYLIQLNTMSATKVVRWVCE